MIILFEGEFCKLGREGVETTYERRIIAANNGIPTINDAIGCVISFFNEYKKNNIEGTDYKLFICWEEEPFVPADKGMCIAVVDEGGITVGKFYLIPDNDILTVNIKEDPDGEVTEEPTSEEE